MKRHVTEGLHRDAVGLDQKLPAEVAALLVEGQIAAAVAVRAALPQIVSGATAMAASIGAGARLHYIAAGSSGLMAAADAQELGGTFSIPSEQLRIHMAGGLPTGVEMPGGTEDDTEGLAFALADLGPSDTVIAVSASGTTPYTVAAAEIARARGATVVGIANNGDTPLLNLAHHAILLPTPPEVLSGSTRMGAGTAQKIALNMLSTLMALELGHVYDGMMVNLRADNIKLRARAAGIVAQAAHVDPQVAEAALDAAQGAVKPATLIAAGGISPAEAQDLLEQTNGNLRVALARLR
ncbi:N-acetylmuramic acid 6-phosphate etherase [Sedimentimonas flavescens]|uniref:N-acetylmuramic acid 6-phosphate etherase n=1 Tax=Sedimentimonas flavescens TaxID=2851012 RepID=A0ABT2ZVD5_9RHOB|nr:N-acetylmuramic acid 6-phosphate etherase [Sedimentimonas flavescens]MCV2877713.1 N-acetylmuramic acid 6-phosphate etherase [Sedimentimonas flavescens]WBL34061.1 N-acetylmuramic acid 6-phosphate etherase [Sinirhodobacter sp. HNIBRBA609]